MIMGIPQNNHGLCFHFLLWTNENSIAGSNAVWMNYNRNIMTFWELACVMVG